MPPAQKTRIALGVGFTLCFLTRTQVKYNTYGGKLWTRQVGGSGQEYATGIKVDGSGDVYLSGVTTGNLDGQNNSGGQDSFVVKYTSNGNKQWTKLLGTTGNDVARDITLDKTGNVLLAGYTGGAFAGNTNKGSDDVFLAKFDTTPNRRPTVNAGNQTVNANQSIKPAFTVSDPDGDAMTYYRFFDGNSGYNSGYFTVNGVKKPAGQIFYVPANQLHTVKFVGGKLASNDKVYVSAYDGELWSYWKNFNIETKPQNRPPVVSATNQTVNTGQAIKPAFTVSDPDGDNITGYYFYDYNSSSTSGYFTVNGVKRTGGFYVSANQLHTVKFVGGSVAGKDNVGLWAYDGKHWGYKSFTIETKQKNRAPIVSASNQTMKRNQSMKPAFTVNDPDGDNITYYAFYDNNSSSNSGYFTVNGVKQAANKVILVPASQINNVRFVGGSAKGNDSVYMTASDGKLWGSWKNFNIATKGGTPPSVSANNQKVGVNQSMKPAFTVSDADGDAITYYRFYDGNGSQTSGYFTVNGVKQKANRYIYVPANQLHTVRFVGGSQPGDDRVYISATDGVDGYSSWRDLVMSTDTAGESLNAARNINIGQSVKEYVSNYDRDDYYRFTLTGRTRVNLSLTGMSADADLRLLNASGGLVTSSTIRGSGNESLIRELNAGTYYVRVNQFSGSTNYTLTTSGQAVQTGPQFTQFSVVDASGDGTSNAVFQQGALKFNWSTNGSNVKIYAKNQITGAVKQLSVINQNGTLLANLNSQYLAAGNYTIYAEAQDSSGNTGKSPERQMKVLAFNPNSAKSLKKGDFKDGTHSVNGMTDGSVFIGRGGSDTLDLSSFASNSVTFNPNLRSVFGGSTFDWLRLNSSGKEVYFQGYEKIKFADKTVNLGITPNDPLFSQQWNLRMMDVPGAWRFTTGSSQVLIGNNDSGIDTINRHQDIDFNRTTLHSQAHDDSIGTRAYGHGTGVHGIMAANTNNGIGLAGINWNSEVYVSDIFGPSSLDGAGSLANVANYAKNTGKKAVVNNSWSHTNSHLWSNGDSRAIAAKNAMSNSNYKDETLYLFASGNEYHNSIAYPSRWAEELDNLISVGAVNNNGQRIGYSNYGYGLSLVAPSHVPSTRMPTSTITINGEIYDVISDPNFYPVEIRKRSDGKKYTVPGFTGTSAAAPNASGVASLVWSANSNLKAGDIKGILTSTANKVWQTWNGSNASNEYGAGLVDAEAAVRRADALSRNSAVASLYNHDGLFFG